MSPQRLDAANCTLLEFEFEVARDKFQSDEFLNVMQRERGGAICRTPSKEIDYHVHLDWSVRKQKVRVRIAYYEGMLPLDKDEAEPYAERAMQWLGQYFTNDNAYATLGAHFNYDPETRVSRFPLPIKLPVVPDIETEIDGVSFSCRRSLAESRACSSCAAKTTRASTCVVVPG